MAVRQERLRWLGKDVLLAVFGMAALMAAQSLELPLEAGRFFSAGRGMVPTTILDVGVAALASCIVLAAGNRLDRLLLQKGTAVAGGLMCVVGLLLQLAEELLFFPGIVLFSAGGAVLLFCWLAAVCSRYDIGVVELLIGVEVLTTIAALLPEHLPAMGCMVLSAVLAVASATAFCLFRSGEPADAAETAPFKSDPATLGKVLCSFFIIGFVVGALQYAVSAQQDDSDMFPLIISVVSLVLVLWLFTRGRDFNAAVWTKVVTTLSLAALVLVLFSSELTYLSYVLAGIAYSLLECGALYIALLLGRLYPDTRIRILGTAWCVVTLGSLLIMGLTFFGFNLASRAAVVLMALLLIVAAIWILEDRNMAMLLLTPGTVGDDTAEDERALDGFCEKVGLTPRERDVFNFYIVGRSAPYIAEKLVLSESTVKSHLQHIYTKCDVHSRQELISLVETTRQG